MSNIFNRLSTVTRGLALINRTSITSIASVMAITATPAVTLIPAVTSLSLMAPASAVAADLKRIDKAADLPTFSYAITDSLEKVVRDQATFVRVTQAIRADAESTLARYDIADKSAVQNLRAVLMQLDFLAGNYAAALAGAETIRALEDKPALKFLSGMRLRAMVSAAQSTGSVNSPAYVAAVAAALRQELKSLPFEVVGNEIREFKASAELISESLILGGVLNVLEPTLKKTGSLSSDLAPRLINARFALETALPLKSTLVAVYGEYLNQHKVEKQDIWAARSVTLPASGPYRAVNVAVWDSGVDFPLFGGQVRKGANGQPASIAFDLFAKPAKSALYPIPSTMTPQLPLMLARTKGFSDMQANVDSAEAGEVKRYFSTLKPAEFKEAVEALGLVGNYVHGTHVAGITVEGNPWVRLLNARISFDYKLQPDPCPSVELSKRTAATYAEYLNFFKKNKVRVVNMSWGGDVKSVEDGLEKCGLGGSTEGRKALARQLFEIEKKGLAQVFARAPEILFITAAGNSDSDATFDESIPSSIIAPNLLTVGAVDRAGDEASFTSYGPTVVVHANGYQVDSFLPGGMRVALSGTSMASPNVANLAAKLLAVKPSLTPTQVIALIRETAERTTDGRRTLMHPAKALERAQSRVQ